MDEPSDRIAQLREQAAQVRVRAIESNQLLIDELAGIWHELNDLAAGRPEVRKVCDRIAGDIARLEKLDLAFDTEWLAEAKGVRP
jgi:hypothetical protein